MNSTLTTPVARRERLCSAIDEFYAAIDAGTEIDRQELLQKYADVADELNDCLDNLDFINCLTPQLTPDVPTQPHENVATTSQQAHLGDFRILREIGRGGMGVVYEAEQLSLGRRVALKVLPFAAMLDKQQLARFKNEARAAATLDHPNIVAIHSVGAERGVHYYAMQLIEGRSLAEVIAALRDKSVVRGPLSVAKTADSPATDDGPRTADPCASDHAYPAGPAGLGGATITGRSPSPEGFDVKLPLVPSPTAGDTAKAALPTVKAGGSAVLSNIPAFETRAYFTAIARLGIQAAEALDHAHQSGILHRDIKPANLLMDDSGKLWVTDFGLARIEQDAGMTMTGDLLGTLRYMSPEQALAKRVVVDHRSDIYSLGVTLYELLALRPVFDGENRQELLRQIAFDEPRPLRQVNRRLPVELETIVLKAMRKNPEQRYATAGEVADDLRRFLEDRPIKAKPPTWREQAAKWARRHPAAVWVVALVTATVAIASVTSTLLINQAYRNESAQRQAAEINARRAEAVSTFLVDAFRSSHPLRDGRSVTIAEVLDRSAKELPTKFADDPRTEAALASAIASTYMGLGLSQEAVQLAERGYKLFLATHGRNHAETIKYANDLIAAYNDEDNYAQAISLGQENVRIATSQLGEDDLETIRALENLSIAYNRTGDDKSAASIGERAYNLAIAKFGRAEQYRFNHAVNLALYYFNTGQISKHDALIGEVERIVLAEKNPENWYELSRELSRVYQRSLKWSNLKTLLYRILDYETERFGRPHIRTLRTIKGLGEVHLIRWEYGTALPLLEEAFEQLRLQRGSADVDTLVSMILMAEALSSMGRHDEARKLCRDWISVAQDNFESDLCNIWMPRYARVCQVLGLQQEALSIRQKIAADKRGSEASPVWAQNLCLLADLHCAQGNRQEATRCFREATSAYKQLRNANPNEPYYWHGQAACHLGAGQVDDYLNVRREMLAHFRDNQEVAVLGRLAFASVPKPFPDDDADDLAWLLESLQEKLSPSDRIIGALLFRSGHFQEACDVWQSLQLNGGKFSAWDHLFYAMSLFHVGELEEATDHVAQAKEWRAKSTSSAEWLERLETAQLLAEAEELLAGGQPPASNERSKPDSIPFKLLTLPQLDALRQTLQAQGRLVVAEAALEEALRHAPSDHLMAYRLAMLKCWRAEESGNSTLWDAAAAAYVQAIDLAPDDICYDSRRKIACRALVRWNEAFERVAAIRPDEPALWIGRAHVHVLNNRWKEAAADYAKVPIMEPLSDVTLEYGWLLLMLDDLPAYREYCEKLVGLGSEPYEDHRVISVLTAHPTVAHDSARLVELAKKPVRYDSATWKMRTLGLAYYRDGKYDAAMECLNDTRTRTTSGVDDAQDCFLVAAILHQQGRTDEAQQYWRTAELEMLDVESYNDRRGIPAYYWLRTHVLRREVGRLLGKDVASMPTLTYESPL